MKENWNDIDQHLTIISDSLIELINSSSFNILIPLIFGLVSSLIGAYIGYKTSRYQNEKLFKKDCHINYLRALNDFLFDINLLISNVVNIEKLGALLLKSSYLPFSFLPNTDYHLTTQKIKKLRSHLDSHFTPSNIPHSREPHYFEKIMKLSIDILDYDCFIQIGNSFEKEAINYFYLIDSDLRNDYESLILNIASATKRDMNEFNINTYKETLLEYIKKVNFTIKSYIQ